MRVALAAHANLWNEQRPRQSIDSFHLIVLPKDGGAFQHRAFESLANEWELFKLYREAYRLDKACQKPAPVAAQAAPASAKPRVRVKASVRPRSQWPKCFAPTGTFRRSGHGRHRDRIHPAAARGA
jgi:hypothetical protein